MSPIASPVLPVILILTERSLPVLPDLFTRARSTITPVGAMACLARSTLLSCTLPVLPDLFTRVRSTITLSTQGRSRPLTWGGAGGWGLMPSMFIPDLPVLPDLFTHARSTITPVEAMPCLTRSTLRLYNLPVSPVISLFPDAIMTP